MPKVLHVTNGKKTSVSAQILEVSLAGVGTVLRIESDAWSMVKLLLVLIEQAAYEYAPLLAVPPRS